MERKERSIRMCINEERRVVIILERQMIRIRGQVERR